MDDYNTSVLSEAKNEYSANLVNILTPLVIQGLQSIFKEACNLCKSNAKNQMDLTTHKILVHGQCQYACKICDFVDPKIARIQKHSAQEHQNKVVYTYKCGFCPFKAKLSLLTAKSKPLSGCQVHNCS